MVRVIGLGPYSGEILDVAGNIRRGMDMAGEAALAGFAVLPCWWDWALATRVVLPMTWFKENTKSWIPYAEAAYLTPGWQNSSGVRADLEVCADYMIPAFTSIRDLCRWTNGYSVTGASIVHTGGEPEMVTFKCYREWVKIKREVMHQSKRSNPAS